jgi:predicted AAA+ superfamily ATPase
LTWVTVTHIMGDMQTTDYLPRLVEPRVKALHDVFPVVVVTGARQTGKSTLVRRPELSVDHAYLTLDDVLLRDEARRDPDLFLDRGERLVIDEVQHAPDLLLAIKRRVDERRLRGRYLLTGSSNLLVQRDVSESLAGRAGYITLLPLTRREQLGLGSAGLWSGLLEEKPSDWPGLLEADTAPQEKWQALAARGGYPTPAHELDERDQRAEWFAGYSTTYLERDLRQLSAIENLADMRRLMAALCLRLGGLMNQAEVSRDLGLPSSTVQRFLNLLEVSHQLVRIPGYSVNRTRRLIKASKIYWSDTGLAMHLSGESSPRGAHLENIVVTDLLAWAGSKPQGPSVLYWRTAGGAEVDFVIELPDRLLPIEVKASRRVTHSDARHLLTFLEDYPAARSALILYDGDEVFWLDRRVLAAPWHRVL